MLTSVDGIGSRGQDLTIAATRILTLRCIFGGDDQRAFLNCMARLLKLAKSVHILGMLCSSTWYEWLSRIKTSDSRAGTYD